MLLANTRKVGFVAPGFIFDSYPAPLASTTSNPDASSAALIPSSSLLEMTAFGT